VVEHAYESYESLDVAPLLGDPGECRVDCASGTSMIEIETAIFEPEGLGTVRVKQSGPNIVAEVKSIQKEPCLKHYDVIELSLDLADPGACGFTPEFEKLGLFLGGIFPGVSGRDMLMLQYLNNVAVDYERIELHWEMGQEILAYIHSNDPNLIET
jgi:hypothetical protein